MGLKATLSRAFKVEPFRSHTENEGVCFASRVRVDVAEGAQSKPVGGLVQMNKSPLKPVMGAHDFVKVLPKVD
jgi:hypothetical protein